MEALGFNTADKCNEGEGSRPPPPPPQLWITLVLFLEVWYLKPKPHGCLLCETVFPEHIYISFAAILVNVS